MNFRKTFSAALFFAALASTAAAQAPQPMAPPGVAASSAAAPGMPPHMPPGMKLPAPPPLKPRFPAAADWKNYGAALAGQAAADLDTAAKIFDGKAAAGKDQLSVAGIGFIESFALSLNSSDIAATRKAVLDCAFAGLKKPGEDPKTSQKNITKFFESRGAFGAGGTPLAAFEKYKALLAQKSDGGAADELRIPLTTGLLTAVSQIKRGEEQQKAIQDFFARAKAELQADAARLQAK